MKYGRTAWVTAQGMVLICAVGYTLLVLKQRYVDGSHEMSPLVFGLLTTVSLSLVLSFASRRALREIKRLQGSGGSR